MVGQKQAIKDMIDFIAEFELWLRGVTEYAVKPPAYDIEAVVRHDTLWDVLDKYRECKRRIEYDDE